MNLDSLVCADWPIMNGLAAATFAPMMPAKAFRVFSAAAASASPSGKASASASPSLPCYMKVGVGVRIMRGCMEKKEKRRD